MRVPVMIGLLCSPALAAKELPPIHTTVCGSRTCRPGEGNPTVTHGENPFEFPVAPEAMKRGPPHEPDPKSAQYAPLVAAAKAIAHQHHHLVIMTAADFDYRELAENWYRAVKRFSGNALVYALDQQAHEHLVARGVASVDGSANVDAWNATRLVRHIQRAEAEKHLAAAALAAAGLDVLLTDTTHVVTGDIVPALAALGKAHNAADAAVPRAGCNGKPPVRAPPQIQLARALARYISACRR